MLEQSELEQFPIEDEQEEIEDEQEVLNFNNPAFKFVPKGRHQYRQRGYYLVCNSCELQHAVWVGKDKLMVGETKNGEPILEKRSNL